MKTPVVVSACGDPGGAGALAPVLERLIADRCVDVKAYAYNQAFELLQRRGLAPQPVPDGADVHWFDTELQRCLPAFVIVATSHNGQDHEKAFVAAARKADIPSMVVLDFWVNYRVRFCDREGDLVFVPDRIAVMDDEARRGLIADGLPEESIVITGHPGFDAVSQRRASFTPAERNAIRRARGTPPDDLQVLFVSQPLCELYGADESAPQFLGFHEESVLDDVIDALERLALRRRIGVTLVIRPHPREKTNTYKDRHSAAIRITVSSKGDPRANAMASDIVVGMTSMLLVEACHLGCTVVSLQPNLRGADVLPTNVRGLIEVIYRREEIASTLERLAGDQTVRKAARLQPARAGPPPLATPRVVDCVYSMISRRYPKVSP